MVNIGITDRQYSPLKYSMRFQVHYWSIVLHDLVHRE